MTNSSTRIAANADKITSTRCRKCCGIGRIEGFRHVEDGLCFACLGTCGIGGRTPSTKLRATLDAEAAARLAAKAAKTKAIDDAANGVFVKDGIEYAVCDGCGGHYLNTDQDFDRHAAEDCTATGATDLPF